MHEGLQRWLLKAEAMKTATMDLLPMVDRAAFYALLWTIPVLALLAMGLNAALPKLDPVTGQDAGAWLAPIVIATAVAIYLGLMLGHLYLHGVLNEGVDRFVGTARDRVSAAAQRADVGTLLDVARARTVAIIFIALAPLLGFALAGFGIAALSVHHSRSVWPLGRRADRTAAEAESESS